MDSRSPLPHQPLAIADGGRLLVPVMKSISRVALDYAFISCVAIVGMALFMPINLSVKVRETFLFLVYKLSQALWKERFAPVRIAVMAPVNEAVSQDPTLRARGQLRVLEVGTGPGSNLPFIRRPVKYWSIDPNREFNEDFRRRLKENPNVELERSILGYGEDMSDVPDGYFDCVVLTYVLCSALDGRKLLGECRRVLAEGGLFLFSEHVAHPLHGLARLMQDVVTPFYKRITCGCHLNRESGNLIQAAGVFKRVHIHEVRVELPLFFNRHVYGYAVA